MACQAPNNGGLASHCYERLYTLGTGVDRRRKKMDKEREGDNGHINRVSPIRDAQA